MRLIENESRILSHLEAIDIEGDEYIFWDANGGGVSVAVSVGAFKSKFESGDLMSVGLSHPRCIQSICGESWAF
jgi:hypothetical protein